MSRAPFKIRKPTRESTETGERGGAAAAQPSHEGDPWLARIVKLVPSEVIAVYLAGASAAKTWLGNWAFVCLILVVIARALGTKEGKQPVQWLGVIVSFISFIIWIYATGGFIFTWKLPANMEGLASIAVLVWTFLVPFFYKGD